MAVRMTFVGRAPCDTNLLRLGAATAPRDPRARTWVLVVAILGSSMAFIDGTVVNVALPAIQSALRASAIDLQWIV